MTMRDAFFLTCGSFNSPAAALNPPGKRFGPPVSLTNTVAVLVRGSGDVVLVDVGWSRETCDSPRAALGRWRTFTLGVQVRPADAIVEQLASLGIAAARVRTVVATHLHPDHIGGVVDFPDAEVVCTEQELAAFRAGGSHYRTKDLAKNGRIRPVQLSGPPALGFSSSHDLFEDGEVMLLDAPGHTAGLAAVAFRTAGQTYVHVGDAVYQEWEYGRAAAPAWIARFIAHSVPDLRRTIDCLRACEDHGEKPILVPSHDRAVYQRLNHSPAHPLRLAAP